MDGRTVMFDAQKEIADLKRRVQQLENEKVHYYQPLRVTDWPDKVAIFEPTCVSSGLHIVPNDAYTAKLHNHEVAFNIGNLQELKTNPELLDALKLAAKDFKTNKESNE